MKQFGKALAMLTTVALSALPALAADTVPTCDRCGVRLAIEIKDQPLDEALKRVAALTGRKLELIGPVDERRITVSLRATTLEESLERILHPSSYTIIWLADGGLAIHVLGEAEDDAGVLGDSPEPTEGLSDNPVSLFPGGEEVLPPSHPGEQGITFADIDYYSSFHTQLDRNDMEVLPPATSDTKGMTQEEMDFLSEIHQAGNPADTELVPPAGDDEFGLTQADFEAMQSNRPVLPPSQVEIVPPDEPGGIGLTLEQLQSMTQARTPHQPLTLNDMIPPE